VNAKDDERMKLLYSIKDPNEYIRAYRAIMAEDNGMQVDELLPFDKEGAGDMVEAFAGQWLALCADLPIERRDQVIELINELIGMLQEWQDYLPAEWDKLRVDILRSLKHGTGGFPR